MPLPGHPLQPILVIGMSVAIALFVEPVPGATNEKLSPATPAAQKGAKVQLQIGLTYEGGGRYGEAEIAYSKAIQDGDVGTKRTAQDALKRVISLHALTAAGSQLILGKAYEREGRLADAEMAYGKVLEGGTPIMRDEALSRMKDVIELRERFYHKHIRPLWDGFAKAIVPILLLGVGFLILPWPLKAYGRHRHRNALEISGFGSESTDGFASVLAEMHERMIAHFRPQGLLLGNETNRMPTLVQSQTAQLAELVGSVSASSVPFAKWILGLLHQPAYRITCTFGATRLETNIRAKLEYAGKTIAQWNRTHPIAGCFLAEQNLAYEVLLKLKLYTDEHAP